MTARSEPGRGRGPLSYQRRHLTITAACATLLSSLPLATVYVRWTWLLDAAIAVAVLCGLALALRTMRLPVWAPTIAMLLALPFVLALQFPSHEEFAGVVPSPGTFRHFGDLLDAAGRYMRGDGAPVRDRPSFLFLSTLGIAAIAIIVDLLAVALRRPAMAGLPMLAVYSVPVAIEDGSVNLLPFMLGAVGFLWLLVADSIDRVRRFGRRFSGDGRDVDLWEPSPLASAGQRLGLIGVALAVAVPVLVPGMTGGLLEKLGAGAGGGLGSGDIGAGTSGRVELDAFLAGNLQRDRAYEMLRVQTSNPDPYYLRYAVADQITPDGFRNREAQGDLPAKGDLPVQGRSAPGTSPRSYQATVEVTKLSMRYLPLYQQPTHFRGIDGSWRFDQHTGTVSAKSRRTEKKQRYAFDYVPPQFPPEALRAAGAIDRDDPAVRDTLGAPNLREAEELVQRLTSRQQTQYDKVLAIFNYFSPDNGFRYDLTTKSGATGSDLLNFLQNKQGFCVQYAAAMAWLVRDAGYPSRVAYGFTRGSGSSGGWTSLSNYNLHAWAEVYFPDYGWVPWDPTPASGVAGSVSTAWAPNPSRPGAKDPAASSSASADPAAQPSTSASARPDAAGKRDLPGGTATKTRPVTAQWPFWTLLGVLAVVSLLAVPGLRRRAMRRRRLRRRAPAALALAGNGPPGGPGRSDAPGGPGGPGAPGGPGGPGALGGSGVLGDSARALQAAREDAHAAWDELLDSMIDYGIAVDGSETPRATARRLISSEIATPAPTQARPPSTGVRPVTPAAAGTRPPEPAAAATRPAETAATQARLLGPAATAAHLLGHAEECARYSQRPLASTDLAASIAAVRAALRARASRRERLRALILPPSVLRRWRTSLERISGNATVSVVDRRDAMARTMSIRRLISSRAAR